ncbi:LysR family transcriptional regulator [Lampropedia puyangensis]|uniref:LysR family transcriptional regulator n=1 Tax=Lampropedia puyangensis TaxID=1330072 RepID=A0A4S8F5A0_9BURK|nr:LysR family transcriptional regulator [Lampropedia puyangensis]THU02598.1 LysR family transcriptional regulator [Lampropedia puyangensis]
MSSINRHARTQLVAGLELLLAIERHRSISKAAVSLGITQSAASRQLQALETMAGAPLFLRTTRSIKPSDAGQALLHSGNELLHNADLLLEGLRTSTGNPDVLKIASSPLFCQQHIVPRLKAFRQAYPSIEIKLTLSYDPIDLARDDIDLLVYIGHLPDRRLVASRIALQRRILCAAPSFLASRGPLHTPEDVSRLPCLIHTQLTSNGLWFHRVGKTLKELHVAGPLASNSTEALLKAAVQGWGLTLMPRWAVHAELQAGTLMRVLPQYDFDIEQQAREICFLWQPQMSRSLKLRNFIDFFSDIFGKPAYWDR